MKLAAGHSAHRAGSASRSAEAGFLPVAVVAMLVPIVVLGSAATAALTGRSQRQRGEVDAEKALQAAEAGLDEAIYELNTGGLAMGVPWQRALEAGLGFTVEAIDQGSDGVDNDGDAAVDEPDEGKYEITATGHYRKVTRRLRALVSHCLQPVTATAGATVLNPALTIALEGGQTRIDGRDRRIDGTLLPASDKPGLTIQRPGTVDDLLAKFPGASDPGAVTGIAGAGCLALSGDVLDVPALIHAVRQNATQTLAAAIADAQLGDGPGGQWEVLVREGNLSLTGDSKMAGVLVVTGDLEVSGSFRFDGLILVGGTLRLSGSSTVYGAVVCQGPQLTVENDSRILYSSEALQWGLPRLSQWAAANAVQDWREIARD